MRNEIEELLSRHGIQYKIRGSGNKTEAVARCPKCGGSREDKESFAINLLTGLFCCDRKNNCAWEGNLLTLKRFLGESERPAPRIKPLERPKITARPAPERLKPEEGDQDKIPEVAAWFKGRGIPEEWLNTYGITYRKGWIGFPIWWQGEIVNVKWRKLTEKRFLNEQGCMRMPFGCQHVDPNLPGLIIVEGEIDLLAAREYGLENVISLPNGTADLDWIEEAWEWLEHFGMIHLCLDQDQAGQLATRNLLERLGSWRCFVVTLPEKDLDDCLMQGVEPEVIEEAILNSQGQAPERVKSIGSLLPRIVAAYDPALLRGTPTGWKPLDDLLGGLRDGELTILTGPNGNGKSTLIGQLAVQLAEQEIKVALASLEMDAGRYSRWIINQYLGQGAPGISSVTQAVKNLAPFLYEVDHVGRLTVPDLLVDFEYCARRHGCKVFIIDSLMCLGLREDDYSGQAEAVAALASFADRFNCHVLLVAHPRKGDSDESRPDKSAIKGTGAVSDQADNVLSIFRGEVTIHKNREHGLLGTVRMLVDTQSKRMRCEAIDPAEVRGKNGRRRDPKGVNWGW